MFEILIIMCNNRINTETVVDRMELETNDNIDDFLCSDSDDELNIKLMICNL